MCIFATVVTETSQTWYREQAKLLAGVLRIGVLQHSSQVTVRWLYEAIWTVIWTSSNGTVLNFFAFIYL